MKPEPGLYDYWPWRNRPRIVWPGGKTIAFWVAPNIEFYELDPPANPSRTPWARPYPAVEPYAMRDYGNRAGHERLMRLMDKYNVRGSISLSCGLVDHHPEIIAACAERNWEFFSHGIYNTRYSYGMDERQERAVLEDSIETVLRATGKRIRGYLAPALTHTERTMDLLAEYDFWYTCDLFQDDQPQPVKTKTGRLISMPYSLEVNDVIVYNSYLQTPNDYGRLLIRHFDQLRKEGGESGTVMCIPLHAYLVGHPYRLKGLEAALAYITAQPDVWVTTAAEIAEHFRTHHWDTSLADIARHRDGQGEAA